MDPLSISLINSPIIRPAIKSKEKDSATETIKNANASKSSKKLSSAQIIDNKSTNKNTNKNELENKIDVSLKEIDESAKQSGDLTTLLASIQYYLADWILKGSVSTSQNGFPQLLNVHRSTIPQLGPAAEGIKFFTDSFDIMIGFIKHRKAILWTAKQKIEELKVTDLDQQQRARLEAFERSIQREESQSSSHSKEQGVRFFRNIFSFFSFTLSWIEKTTLISTLIQGSNVMIGGINAILYGILFNRARNDLKVHEKWANDFSNWVKNQPLRLIGLKPFPNKEEEILVKEHGAQEYTKSTLENFIQKQKANRQGKIDLVKSRIERNEIDLSEIKAKVQNVKNSVILKATEGLLKHKVSADEISKKLQEKFQVPISIEVVKSIQNTHNNIKAICKVDIGKFVDDLLKHDFNADKVKKHFEENFPFSFSIENMKLIQMTYQKIKDIEQSNIKAKHKKLKIEKRKENLCRLIKDQAKMQLGQQKQIIFAHLNAYAKEWVDTQTKDSLLESYVDYQSAIDFSLKNSLNAMLKTKHEVEKSFLKVKKVQHRTYFYVASAIFGIAASLMIIALIANPVGATALVLGLLAVGSVAISAGMIMGGYYYASKLKPEETAATLKGAYAKLFYYGMQKGLESLKENINAYLKEAWHEKRDKIAKTISNLPLIRNCFDPADTEIPPLFFVQNNEKVDFQKINSKVTYWVEKTDALQKQLDEMIWRDFAKQANLKVAKQPELQVNLQRLFDFIEELNEAVRNADFELLDLETKSLIEMQLGIDIQSLPKEIEKNPDIFKKLVFNFFKLDDSALVKFIREQNYIVN